MVVVNYAGIFIRTNNSVNMEFSFVVIAPIWQSLAVSNTISAPFLDESYILGCKIISDYRMTMSRLCDTV